MCIQLVTSPLNYISKFMPMLIDSLSHGRDGESLMLDARYLFMAKNIIKYSEYEYDISLCSIKNSGGSYLHQMGN